MLINLRRELRLRLRQAAVLSTGLGIAVGAGLLTMPGPASAAQAAAGHPAVHLSQVGRGGRGCQIKSAGVGQARVRARVRCCPPRAVRRPGRPFTVRCCAPPVPPGHARLVVACCPAPVRARHGGPVTVRCCPARAVVPPPGRQCKIHIRPGGVSRRCPGPPVRCRVHIKPGQGG